MFFAVSLSRTSLVETIQPVSGVLSAVPGAPGGKSLEKMVKIAKNQAFLCFFRATV